MHEHCDCEHELKYCKVCDTVYCKLCHKEWRYSSWWYCNGHLYGDFNETEYTDGTVIATNPPSFEPCH